MLLPGETGVSLLRLDEREVTAMASQSQRIDGSPTILWIAWKAGEVEHEEALCLIHRAHIFELYPTTAHGLKRRGERCAMCAAHPPRTAQLHNPRDSTTSPGEAKAVEPRGRAARGSGRRVSPTRHDPSYAPVWRGEEAPSEKRQQRHAE